MDKAAFIKAFGQSRNGANEFYFHRLAKSFHYSDGVRDCARAGCYWLLDIAAIEFPAAMRKHEELHAILEVHVKADKTCELKLTVANDKPIWSRTIDYTDMPVGYWYFELGDETERVAMILLTEHWTMPPLTQEAVEDLWIFDHADFYYWSQQ